MVRNFLQTEESIFPKFRPILSQSQILKLLDTYDKNISNSQKYTHIQLNSELF
jgi:hypothetical protein